MINLVKDIIFSRLAIALAGCAVLSVAAGTTLFASSPNPSPISVVSGNVVSEFPEGMRFSLELESEHDIEEIAVRFRVGQQTSGVYEYMEVEGTDSVRADLFWRTSTRGKYIPPGTIITYNFEIEDVDGNRLDTEPAEFVYYDARFEWEEVSEGPIAVAYHGPVKKRAEIILEAILQTLDIMGPLLGADTIEPIRVTMYNNVKEMLEALPPGSSTIRRELITEGQAFTDMGTLLVLGGGRLATGTASHEVIHILTHRAGDSTFGRVPAWLDEGLAEFGNIDPSFSYDIALEFALGTDRLLPITSMPILPGDPEDVIIFYGQASSLVHFMVAAYGPRAMRDLMTLLGQGTQIDDAIVQVYGVERIELENQWRDALGADLYVPPDRESMKPTPIPRQAVQLYSLTPVAGTETIATIDATPTPTPEPSPMPEPTATQPPAVAVSSTESGDDTSNEDEEVSGGSGCSAPSSAGMGMGDAAIPLLGIGLVGLALLRRRR